MRYLPLLIGLGVVLLISSATAITPEKARKELAQENIPYTAEAMLNQIEKGNTEIVGWFLAIGMDVNATNEFGETPLIVAATKGEVNIAALLIAKGARENLKTKSDFCRLISAF